MQKPIFQIRFSSFTLIELSVVIAIFVLILMLAFPQLPKSEKSKSSAREVYKIFSDILEKVIGSKKNLKVKIAKKDKKIEIYECVPSGEIDELWREKQKEIQKLKDQIGGFLPFVFEEVKPISCEWKRIKEIKVGSEITAIFVENEETFGADVEILFQRLNIPFVEIELDNKNWVIVNPYTLRVIIKDKPLHRI